MAFCAYSTFEATSTKPICIASLHQVLAEEAGYHFCIMNFNYCFTESIFKMKEIAKIATMFD